MDSIQELFLSLPVLMVISALIAYVMATRFNLYPVIIYVSKTKGLMDVPEERRVHTSQVPNLGGMGLFITFSLTLLLFVPFLNNTVEDLSNILSLLAATIILLFLGIKDDLVFMTAKKKLVIQLIAVSMVCILQNVRISNFHGLLGIGELPYIISVGFTIFVFVLVINAINLIDGIDGLASSIGILASLSFGIAFYMAENYLMTIMAAVLIGSLMGFLKYNLSSDRKIFMGDCGSLIVGFLLAYQGIGFLNINPELVFEYNSENSSILLLAILSYPLFDLLRVFIVRIAQKKSPFDADSNHIHHRLLRLGLNHKQATMFLVVSNLTLILITYFTINLPINMSLIVVVCFGCLLYLLPFLSVFEEFKGEEPEEITPGVSGRVVEVKEDGAIIIPINERILQKETIGQHRNYGSLNTEPERVAKNTFPQKNSEKFKYYANEEKVLLNPLDKTTHIDQNNLKTE
ncbi:UDP-N-acetylmuramyl pentapeptide phosphotransferase/UDP-N-acetylglucosamine-1-phosphate transferase [Maribacter sedimenticola]|uniref:UDP-N-acetylmuramyl pentapeptide phosphotransferase/UDP-N-acetylglucosamine-1-phosphate transferase n=1 Tax=Maribacter sedimenticola TaxID=228956 RepID=A0ABY1SE05_9FLAO|nr:MraY family glycosyltransferase [Maribacter sedimenticola]SNR30074.1 UDP-N-acetylmuramyl pentapeptide phosphotransferase/UDP-N-acetylglucosamine-1-phosphate transferase [Maribacter sedimenticola]